VLQGEKSEQFVRREPQSRQREATVCSVVAVAVSVFVVNERRVQFVAQIGD
jgi:hypothetical protein